MTAEAKAKLLIVEDDEGLQRQLRWAYDDYDVLIASDRGAGMSPDFVRSRLFQPFVSTKDGGFGVGAFEARALVAAMGGRVEVESREGEGTSFTVFLPLAAISEAYSPERMCA